MDKEIHLPESTAQGLSDTVPFQHTVQAASKH